MGAEHTFRIRVGVYRAISALTRRFCSSITTVLTLQVIARKWQPRHDDDGWRCASMPVQAEVAGWLRDVSVVIPDAERSQAVRSRCAALVPRRLPGDGPKAMIAASVNEIRWDDGAESRGSSIFGKKLIETPRKTSKQG